MSKYHPPKSSIEYPIESGFLMSFLGSNGFFSKEFDFLHRAVIFSKKPLMLVNNGEDVKNDKVENPIKIDKGIMLTKTQVMEKLEEAKLSITDFDEYMCSKDAHNLFPKN